MLQLPRRKRINKRPVFHGDASSSGGAVSEVMRRDWDG